MENKISASIMCADLCNLQKSIEELEDASIDYLHWDIMDGNFVPNFSLSQDIMKSARRITNIKFDTHLMIQNPERYINDFVETGSDLIVIHAEATNHLHRAIQQIKDTGIKVGVALNPATPINILHHIITDLDMVLIMTVNPGFAGQKMIPATLDKISEVKRLIEDRNLTIDIQVDGNVSFENIPQMRAYGANVFVAGTSSVFHKDLTIKQGVKKMLEAIGS